jgi:hypothetical protein
MQVEIVHNHTIEHRLHHWNPEIDIAKLQLIEMRPVTWNNSSLGCPMPGMYYTQALVEGFLMIYSHEGMIIEVHTDKAKRSAALPGVGYI